MTQTTDSILTITDAACEKVLEVRSAEPDPETLALWVEVSGQADGAYTYVMEFRPVDEAGELDLVETHGDLAVVIDGDSVDRLRSAVLDFTGAGMVMRNPNQPEPPAPFRPEAADLSSPLAQQVLSVLEEQVNPAIAAHGGRADLVAVEADTAFVHMSGGCQGCGMAAATLKQGIETAILDAVPEIAHVVDVTDHAAGSTPYYAATH